MKSHLPLKFWALTFILLIGAASADAQGTFSRIRTLMQTHCSGGGSSCHDTASQTFNVWDPNLYNNLVNAAPLNPEAITRGYKRVIPGDPQRSFLLRKIAHGISSGLQITLPEGKSMPEDQNALPALDIEMVRQWILHGAPQTGECYDTALVAKYYSGKGINDTYNNVAPPPPGQGFQIYMGKIFVPPATETEYFIKYNMGLNADIEVPRLDNMMPAANHHFVLYRFLPGQASGYPAGLRDLNQNSHASVTTGIGAGPGFWGYQLPPGTAYFFEQGMWADLNLHIRNNNPDSVLGTDLYVNVYTQPIGTATDYMLVRNFINENIVIPQDTAQHKFTVSAYDESETRTWKIWQLYSHTHRYGTKYDIFLRDSLDQKGERVYDGDYSYEDGFNVGYYRWGVDATMRYWPDNDLFEVDPRLGFIHEATYRNTAGPNPVTWGLTSQDEMMVMGFQYIYGPSLTGISEPSKVNSLMKVFPNPSRDQFVVSYKLEQTSEVRMELFNMIGERLAVITEKTQQKGSYRETLDCKALNLSSGIYFLNTTINGATATEKLIVTE